MHVTKQWGYACKQSMNICQAFPSASLLREDVASYASLVPNDLDREERPLCNPQFAGKIGLTHNSTPQTEHILIKYVLVWMFFKYTLWLIGLWGHATLSDTPAWLHDHDLPLPWPTLLIDLLAHTVGLGQAAEVGDGKSCRKLAIDHAVWLN